MKAILLRSSAAALIVLLAACGGGGPDPCSTSFLLPGISGPSHASCVVATPFPTCDEVSVHPWTLEGPGGIPLGESRPFSFAQLQGMNPISACQERIASVTWETNDSSVVSMEPVAGVRPSRAWLTALARGQATVTARVKLVDGTTRVAGPANVRIDQPFGAPGARLIASGRVEGLSTGSACMPISSCSHESFELPASGRVDIVMDWVSPLDAVGFDVYAGRCVYPGCFPTLLTSGPANAKPMRGRGPRFAAGPYTFVPRNAGPGIEDVTYEVWLSP